MIFKCTAVLCLLAIDFGSTLIYDEGYNQYKGPSAPLNPDGTVAFTPEYEHIRDEHRAAFEREYQRVRNSINTVDPYTIPNSLKAIGYEDHGQYLPEIHEEETYDSPSPAEEEGHYHLDLYEQPYSSLYDDGQYRPHLFEQGYQIGGDQYNSQSSTQGTFYGPSYAPATLNADGSVAHIPGYNAIASSFLAYHQALSRHRRSAKLYQGPPAPLNDDLTVDYTPEVKHVNAAHFTAVASQFKRLQATAALAAAHPDRTSPTSKDYDPQSNEQHNFVPHSHYQGQNLARKKRSYAGQYSPQSNAGNYDDGQYRPHLHEYDDGQYRPHLHKHDDGQYKQHEQSYDDGQYKQHDHKYDNGQYRPHQHKHENGQYNQHYHRYNSGQYRPHHQIHDHGQYKPHLHQFVDYRSEPFSPAPLNPDGTVAHVPEYHAIAASHLAAHDNVLSSVSHHQ